MKADRALLIERGVLVAGFLAMVVSVAAFDWRLGLGLCGLLMAVSSLDLPWRRP